MAYDPRPRQRPPPRRYEEPQMNGGGSFPRDPSSNHRWQDRDAMQGAWQSNGHLDHRYDPQNEYDNYSQNPWINEANEYRGQYEDYRGDPYGNYANTQQLPPPRKERHEPSQPQQPRSHDQYPPRKASQPYDDGQWNHSRHEPSQRGFNRSGSEPRWDEYQPRAPPDERGQPHDWPSDPGRPKFAAMPNESDDQLPRYMNGHAHRFSDDARQTALKSGRPGGHATRSHDRSRPHGASISSRSSHERPNYEHWPSTGRPQTAEGYRRKGVSPTHAEPGYNMPGSRHDDYSAATGFHSAPNAHGQGRLNLGNPAPALYERSQTMPATVHGPGSDSGLIPVDNSRFEEPGAVSGFYGTQIDGLEHGRPQAPSRSQTDDPKWASNHPSRPVLRQGPHHQFSPVESRGEIVNAYQDDNTSTYPPYQDRRPANRRFPSAEDEMPNFETSKSENHGGRDLTFENHMQPNVNKVSRPQMRNGAPPEHFNGRDAPRSRSQPDFSMEQPPYGRQPEIANTGRPRPAPYDRPATSAGAREYPREPNRDPYAPPGRSRGPGNANHQYSTDGRNGNGASGFDDDHRSRGQSPAGPYGRPPFDGRSSPGPWPPRSLPNRGPMRQHTPQNERFQGSPLQQRNAMPGSATTPQDNRQQSHDSMKNSTMRNNDANGKPPIARHKGHNLSLDKPLPNPDALPHHPAPAKPPLTSPPNTRPTPVRQYNSVAPDPTQNAGPQSAGSQRNTPQVTVQELEYLRQKTLKNPNDSATQFKLAQRLVEAADVIIDERADEATKKRNRDRYQADALKIIKKLSALSYADADFYYADCYSRGALGLPCDIKEAFLLYQKAAKANHAQAAYRVAVCCELGQEDGGGTKRDAVKAMQWYRRAATLGDVASKYKLGVILLKGLLGQPRNSQEGVGWLKKAAEQADKENPHALHELGLMHEKGSSMDGIRQDEAYARQSFIQAANLGYKFSQFRLGCAYEYGLLGCPVDPRQSIAWYSKAAVQEEHQSELALSGWYLTGAEGVLQQSDTEAYLWARKAAQAGLAKAEYAMGYFTEVGIGAPANLEDAKRWYWKSASQNFPKARDRLEDLRRGGGPKQKTRMSRSNMRKQSDGECIIM